MPADDAADVITAPFLYSVKEYLAYGWPGTIPLPPGAKSPPPSGCTGSTADYPTMERIKAWCDHRDETEFVGDGNIGLHLGPISFNLGVHPDLPSVYGGHIVTGWEVIGIDVDTYKDKNGYRQLLKLEEQLGKLPPTARSSSRWHSGATSYIAVYIVPAGFRYLGKAAGCIEVIQKRHRYMVVWPSTNPDANNARYEWRDRKGQEFRNKYGKKNWAPIPTIKDLELLPESWWAFLSNNGMPESEDPISDMSGDELLLWAKNDWRDTYGDMCADLEHVVDDWIVRIQEAAECHPMMVPAQWQILRYGAEGHKGALTALINFNDAWIRHARQQRDGPVPNDEVRRGVIGALGKIQPTFTGLAEDPCECKEAVRNGDYDDRLSNWDAVDACACGNPDCRGCDIGKRIANSDYSGLGPVVGRLQIIKDNPSDSYGMHDEGNGQHFVDMYGDNVKFIQCRNNWALWLPPDGSPGSGRWYADFGGKYTSLAYQRVRIKQEDYARALTFEAVRDGNNPQLKSKAKTWSTWAKRSGNISPIGNALDSAQRLYVDDNTPVTLNGREFDSHPKLLGCANGVLELTEDPDLREPRRDDFVTYNTNVPYIPWRTLANGDDQYLDGYHLWQEYLTMFLPDPEIRHFVQKVMGHLLVGENPEKLLIFLYGPHDSGKSTMIGAIAGALGDYFGTIDMNMFSGGSRFNPQLIQSCPLRVTGMSEVDAGVMDAATVKRLTGNDRVVVEQKFSDQKFEGRPQFTTIIACNNPPDINRADDALRERILALPFSTSIDRSLRKYERQTQIEQYSGIAVLSWLVEGWILYCLEGIKRDTWPATVRILHGEIVAELNSTQSFISQHILRARDFEEGVRIENEAIRRSRKRCKRAPTPADWPVEWTPSASQIYEMYVRWSMANGAKPLNFQGFTTELGVGRPKQRKVNGENMKCYVGVMVKP